MKKNIFILLLLAFSLYSCYEDKGNYDYRDIEELYPITFPEYEAKLSVDVSLGDIISINPTFGREIPKDADYLKYKWALDQKTREGWDKRNFYWIADSIIPNYVDFALEVTDTRSGVVYFKTTRIRIISPYDATGWLVLSELDSKSALSFIKETASDGNIMTEAKVYRNVFALENNDASMGTTPINIQEHFADRGPTGQITIFQDNPIDLNGSSFKKEINLAEAFMGGVMPAKIVGGSYMYFVDVMEDDKGHIYTRIKSTDKLFHSNKFLSDPVKFQGITLEGCKVIRGRYANSYASLIYDTKKQRLLYLFDMDPAAGKGIPAEIKVIPEPTYGTIPKNYFPLNDMSGYDLLYIGAQAVSYDACYAMVLKEKDTGKYYYQQFATSGEFKTTNFSVGDVVVQEIIGLDFEPDLIYVPPYEECPIVLMTKGDKLYIFERGYTMPIEIYIDFGKFSNSPTKITAIDADVYRSRALAVGMENGDFFVVKIENSKNLVTDDEKIKMRIDSKDNLGRIIKIQNKVGTGGNGWN